MTIYCGSMIKPILREPLVHFTLLGITLFIIYSLVSTKNETENTVIIDEYDINEITSKWNLQWQRNPTPEELKGLLDAYVKEEIMYREALNMNLDHNDEVIKRRMAQKFRFLTQDIAEMAEPGNSELKEYLQQNQDKYIVEQRIRFKHVFFNPDKRENAKSDALSALHHGNPSGDKSPVRNQIDTSPLSLIQKEFGTGFAQTVRNLKVDNNWQGPVESGYGFHLVKVIENLPQQNQTLEEARTQLTNDYLYDLQNQINEKVFESLLEKYEVKFNFDQGILTSDGQ